MAVFWRKTCSMRLLSLLDKMKPAILITVLILVAITAISAISSSGWGWNNGRRPLHEFSKVSIMSSLLNTFSVVFDTEDPFRRFFISF